MFYSLDIATAPGKTVEVNPSNITHAVIYSESGYANVQFVGGNHINVTIESWSRLCDQVNV